MDKNINFEKCYCGNTIYNIYRNFGERKVIECSVCGLLRSFPRPHKSVCDDNYQSLNDIQRLHYHQLFVLKQILSQEAYVVVAVPNIGGHNTFKNDWIGYQFDQHYWHFTPGSLSEIFQQNDFSVFREFTLSGGAVKSFFCKMFDIKGDSLITVFRYEK